MFTSSLVAPSHRSRRDTERRIHRRLRQFGTERLEARWLLAFGDLLHTLDDPSTYPQESSHLGEASAVDGDLTVVAAPDADADGIADTGRVYVYETSSGDLITTLRNPTPAMSDRFGASVAISGNKVVVGAHGDDTGAANAGAAYVFDALSGALLQTLTNPTPATADFFGFSVAVSANSVVVGAHGDDSGTTDAGAVYVFDATSGVLLQTLLNPTPAADYFGYSVAVSGNTVAVGAFGGDAGASDAGMAYIFDAVSGTLLQTLSNPTPAENDTFGNSVAISGNLVLVGAHRDDTGATDAGAAYIFDATSGVLLRTLSNPTPGVSDYFGSSVAVSGHNVVVAARNDNGGATDAGAAYVFDVSDGTLLRTLTNPSPATYDYFGSSVAISGTTAVVGAYYDDVGASDAGAVYVFDGTSKPLWTLSQSIARRLGQSWCFRGGLWKHNGRRRSTRRLGRCRCGRGPSLRCYHRYITADPDQSHARRR